MVKYSTTYTVNNKVHPSEIYCPTVSNIELILDIRNLTNEKIVSEEILTINYTNTTERISYYIEQRKYVDAIHRFFYLATIVGEGLDFIKYIQDDGLAHKLAHVKTSTAKHCIADMIKEADKFEASVSGTYLWALAQ